MNILVVGSGAREHALVWRLVAAGHRVTAAPGNPGIAAVAECIAAPVGDLDAQVAAAAACGAELVVVGPEAPLCAGLADRLRAAGFAVFGPSAAGARLEGSKIFAKELFARHGIRTAEFATCASPAEVDAALARLGDAVVVKADGLAAGKGVVVCADAAEARAAAAQMIEGDRFGAAGRRVVIERRLRGRELSVMAITDGRGLAMLAQAEDHKQLLDGDRGPNTGGMGTVSPVDWVSGELVERIRAEILAPTLGGLAAEGIDYRGVLYAGLMVDDDGVPWVIEYNCRFGDPETEPVLARLDDDLAPWLAGAAAGALPAGQPRFSSRAAVCVVIAAERYPEAPAQGDVIDGLDELAEAEDVVVFHAGTARRDGQLVTAGGRVLAVTALGADLATARARAYDAVAGVRFRGMQYRRDIGGRGKRGTS